MKVGRIQKNDFLVAENSLMEVESFHIDISQLHPSFNVLGEVTQVLVQTPHGLLVVVLLLQWLYETILETRKSSAYAPHSPPGSPKPSGCK